MKKIFVLLFMISAWVASAMAAATATDIANGSIVTIQYSTTGRNATTYYLRNNNGKVGTITALDESDLWEYQVDASGNISLRSISAGTTNPKYLHVEGKETRHAIPIIDVTLYYSVDFTLSIGNSPSAFKLANADNATAVKDTYINATSLSYTYKGNLSGDTYTGYIEYNNPFDMATGNETNTLRIQVWDKIIEEPNITFSMNQNIDFGLQCAELGLTTPAQTVECALTYQQAIYYQNRSNTTTHISLQDINITDAQAIANTYGITPSFTWDNAAPAANISMSTVTMVNKGTTKNPNYVYHFTLTPNGDSPIGVKGTSSVHDLINHVTASATVGENTSSAVCTVTRQAFVYETYNGIVAEVNPTSIAFKANKNLSAQMTITMEIQDVVTYYSVATGRKEYSKEQVEGTIDLTDPAVRSRVTYTIDALSDDVGMDVDWVTLSPSGNAQLGLPSNTISVTVTPNETLLGRACRMNSQFNYEDEDGTKYTGKICQGFITQSSLATEAGIKFHPNIGKGDNALDARGHQRVHEYNKTIYYISGEAIAMYYPEPSFSRWARWYDLETNHSPQYNDPNGGFSWVQKPRYANNTDFKEINEDQFSFGMYATNYNNNILNNANNVPKFKAWTDNQTHILACDLSDYTDYTFTPNTTNPTDITEPTLSYRLIYKFIPASVIADSLAKCTGNTYYETHQYVVPTGQDAYLETNFRYHSVYDDVSELCYWYYDTNHQLKHVGGTDANAGVAATWYKNGQAYAASYNNATVDMLQISYTTADVDTFELRAGNINIARFYVTAMPRTQTVATKSIESCGPSTTELVSSQDIRDRFVSLAEIDFNFGADEPAGDYATYAPVHMPWSDASYGFAYQNNWPGGAPGHNRAVNDGFVSYGEYALLTTFNQSWAAGSARNGYCLYVDGMAKAGLVASISTDTRICSGQLMYCSAWICNPRTSRDGELPIFRFNVEGRNDGEDTWHDIGVFMAGEFKNNSGWQQVVFPLVSAQDYTHVRVSLYNFAKGNNGNDFLVDDIHLFASKLPLSSYQATTSCVADDQVTGVIRLDYANLEDGWEGQYLYYDLYDATEETSLIPATGYYYRDTVAGVVHTEPYGYFIVPDNKYNPTKSDTEEGRGAYQPAYGRDETKMVYSTITAFIDSLTNDYAAGIYTRPRKGYVQEEVLGELHWVLYLVATLGNLDDTHDYKIRMAAHPNDLNHSQCALTTDLPITKQTNVEFDGRQIPGVGDMVCPNSIVAIDMAVSNETSAGVTVKGTCKADWLFGYESDTIYLPHHERTPEMVEIANAAFKAKYGYSRDTVESAIWDLRRPATESNPNPNINAGNFNLIVKSGFNNEHNYEVIKALCDGGWLKLYTESLEAYMLPQQELRYWVFPVDGTGISVDGDSMSICNQPVFMDLKSDVSQYVLNFCTLDTAKMTQQQRFMIPGVRVSTYDANHEFTVPVSNISNCVIGYDSTQLYRTNDPILKNKMEHTGVPVSVRYWQDRIYQDAQAAAYYLDGQEVRFHIVDQARVDQNKQRYIDDNAVKPGTWTEGHPGWQIANTDTLRPGFEYVFQTTMMTTTFKAQNSGEYCPVGETFFNLIVVPDTMLWSPKGNEYNNWSDDVNWRAIVRGDTLDYGYVPMKHVVVIIPDLEDEKLYPYISNDTLSIDAHFSPITCKKIHFAGNSKMINQERLKYEQAYADLVVPAAEWCAVSSPLQNTYSGDMYTPDHENADPCIVNPLDHARAAEASHHYWASYFNHSVNMYEHVDDETPTLVAGHANAWSRSNLLDEPIKTGQGFGVLGFGPNFSEEGSLLIRLPKTETQYTYAAYGEEVDKKTTILKRDSANRLALQLVNGQQQITLTNTASDVHFLFGNPSMAYIDMFKFLQDNNLKGTFQYAANSNWRGATRASATAPEQRYLAPMHAAIIEANTPATSLTVTLKKEHLSLYANMDAALPTPTSAPTRQNARIGYLRSDAMNILAFNDDAMAATRLCINNFAEDGFLEDEDAPMTFTPMLDDAALNTPMTIYTVADATPLTADVRSQVECVPLGMLIDNDYRSATIKLYFNLSQNWAEQVWLYDAQTGACEPIYDGITYEVETPSNRELRYFIVNETARPMTPTDLETVRESQAQGNTQNANNVRLSAYTLQEGFATLMCSETMTEIKAFDVTGKCILCVRPVSNTCTMALPSGMVLFQAQTAEGKTTCKAMIR